ncbi:MAG: class I SAM-dependent methyltransferase [Bacteroidota bacterium]
MNYPAYKKHIHCLLCEKTQLSTVKMFSASFLVKCNSCGFVFTERIPSPEELQKHYAGYLSISQLSPVTALRYNELLSEFEKFRNTSRILDVGCGNGLFLEVAKKRNWQVFGTEFTEENVMRCREKGITVFKGDITENNFEKESFDVVVSFEVLEHINNPVAYATSIRQLLRKGGMFYFTTPNFNALNKYLLGSKWNIVEYPEHLGYFTKRTAVKLFTSCGFEKEKIMTTGINLHRYQSSLQQHTLPQENHETPDELLRKKIESRKLLKFAKSIINFFLDKTSLGDSLKGYFVRL